MATDSTLANSYGPEALEPTPNPSPLPAKAYMENSHLQLTPAVPQKRSTFHFLPSFLLGFIVAAILVGASVGGGLGASLGKCHKSLK
jgi:hypothetical protein